jgi:signal transduction histidine kinase/CheY-like chemotaxis protein
MEAQARRRLEALTDLSNALCTALTREEVARVVVDRGMRAANADTCVLYVKREDGALELLADRGAAAEVIEQVRHLDPSTPNASLRALQTGESLWVETEEGYRSLFPELADIGTNAPRARAFWSVPLVVGGVAIGVIGMGFYRERTFSPDERVFVHAFAGQCAQALRRAAVAAENARLYRAEREARELADASNRMKDEFLATVSHELRTPLNAILGWARLLSSTKLDDARRGRAVAVIERNALTMAQLVEDLLDVSRIVSGKMRLDVRSVDLPAVLDAALDAIRPVAEMKRVSLVRHADPSAAVVRGDAARLQQVAWNLLSNAVKFTPADGRVEVALVLSGEFVELSVNDNGKGIDPRFLPHVFEPFRQAEPTATRAHGGLGLGLAITRRLIELHGGRIEARSPGEGLGATFVVHLPLSGAREATVHRAIGATPGRPIDVPPGLRGLHVLVVDDDDDTRQLTAEVLERCGCRVTLVGGAAEALRVIEGDLPQVVLSDIGMPDEDGLSLIRRIRALTPAQGGGVPAAALTAYARQDDRRAFLRAGYTMHLTKPLDPCELVAAVVTLSGHASPTSRTTQG